MLLYAVFACPGLSESGKKSADEGKHWPIRLVPRAHQWWLKPLLLCKTVQYRRRAASSQQKSFGSPLTFSSPHTQHLNTERAYVHMPAGAESSRFYAGRRPVQGRRPVPAGVLRSQSPLPLHQRHTRIYGAPTGGPEQGRAASSVGFPAVPPIVANTVSNNRVFSRVSSGRQ